MLLFRSWADCSGILNVVHVCVRRSSSHHSGEVFALNGGSSVTVQAQRVDKHSGKVPVVHKQAIKLNPDEGWLYHCLGTNALVPLKYYEEALINYDQCIRLDPNYIYAYYAKSEALYQLKRYDEALEVTERCLQLDPNYGPGYYQKGWVLTALGKTEGAKSAYEKAKQFDQA